jgi:hypothetical protein
MKNVIAYRIRTKYGSWYETDNRGYVIKCDNGLDKSQAKLHDLMTWQITGIREIRAFGNLGHLIRLDEASHLDNFKFKNGNPRYTIEDIDHGTKRIHGNWKCHGCISVEKI